MLKKDRERDYNYVSQTAIVRAIIGILGVKIIAVDSARNVSNGNVFAGVVTSAAQSPHA
jgi:hypothetical protein